MKYVLFVKALKSCYGCKVICGHSLVFLHSIVNNLFFDIPKSSERLSKLETIRNQFMRQETLTISASAMLQTSKLELVHKFWFLRKTMIQYMRNGNVITYIFEISSADSK